MSDAFLADYKSSLSFAFSLFEKYLAICPPDIWEETFGGWPVAQQYYHALHATGLFLAALTGQEVTNPVPGAGDLKKKDGGPLPTKVDANLYLSALKDAIDALHLDDHALLEKNAQASQVLGKPVTNAAVLELMACHMHYHLGACDAALRAKGLEGAF